MTTEILLSLLILCTLLFIFSMFKMIKIESEINWFVISIFSFYLALFLMLLTLISVNIK